MIHYPIGRTCKQQNVIQHRHYELLKNNTLIYNKIHQSFRHDNNWKSESRFDPTPIPSPDALTCPLHTTRPPPFFKTPIHLPFESCSPMDQWKMDSGIWSSSPTVLSALRGNYILLYKRSIAFSYICNLSLSGKMLSWIEYIACICCQQQRIMIYIIAIFGFVFCIYKAFYDS